MPRLKLHHFAEAEVERTRARLPEDVRSASEECGTWYEEMEVAGAEDPGLPEDLLGLFEGLNRMDPPPAGPEDMPRIRLFLDNLWEYAGGDESEYRREVRITWLHELGHCLGWGEAEVEALGLG